MTELVFILDQSGSMQGLERDTIGGFNAMLAKERKHQNGALVTTVLFNHDITTLHDRLPIAEVPPMTDEDYAVGGCTALLDAVGGTIKHIAGIHKYARKEDVPEKTLFIITTDGMENASCRYDYDQVQALIEEKKAMGWEFLFLGANMDAAEEAGRMGIEPGCAVTYCCDDIGVALNYEVLGDVVVDACKGHDLRKDWKKRIEEDEKRRNKRR